MVMTLIGIFDDEAQARRATKELNSADIRCRYVNELPLPLTYSKQPIDA